MRRIVNGMAGSEMRMGEGDGVLSNVKLDDEDDEEEDEDEEDKDDNEEEGEEGRE